MVRGKARSVSASRRKTAIRRPDFSRPVAFGLRDGFIVEGTSVFDYGCGHGDDIRRLKAKGFQAEGWDPAFRPNAARSPADVVNLGFVVNVIEEAGERQQTLRRAWDLAQRVLIIGARLRGDVDDLDRFDEYGDGCVTGLGTFQKFFDQHELRDWVDATLGVSCVPAAPGVVYVFRDESLREAFLAQRFRRRRAAPRLRKSDVLFEANRDLLQPLMDFVTDRGRAPKRHELASASEIEAVFGSLKRAFAVIRRVTGAEEWTEIETERKADLLVYLALARLGGRPRMGALPKATQLDMRTFFSSYKRACKLADELLYSAGDMDAVGRACRASPLGKETPSSLYVHREVLEQLAPILRVYEGCARSFAGSVDGANVVKLGRQRPSVSYLSYPRLEKQPHPPLVSSLKVDLGRLRIHRRSFAASENPPILHRKEELVAPDHPSRELWSRLTAQEERWALYANPSEIGTKQQWEELLARTGVTYRGHRLIRRKS